MAVLTDPMSTTFPRVSVPGILGLFAIVLIAYGIAKAIYNVFFHPLRIFPGPKLHAATSMRQALSVVYGKPHEDVLELHKKYGEVVRVGPNELSFIHEGAWKEICGHVKQGQAECGKDQRFASEVQDASLISASRERHSSLRRALAHAFSAKAMAEQMPLINQYFDLLIRRLHEHGEYGKIPLNMVHWYDWTTFDIIGDLAFGEPFGSLETGKPHPWVSLFNNAQKFIPLLQSMHDLPFWKALKPFYMMLYPPIILAGKRLATSQEFSTATVNKRINLGTSRPDFVEQMLKQRPEYTMTHREIRDTSLLLTTAGSETTATVLAATTYLILAHPVVLQKLTAEVRSAFTDESEITMNSVQSLPYMLAVLRESMRVFPPVPVSLPRVAPPSGILAAGGYIPGGTILGLWQYTIYHSPTSFKDPDSFVPERWLGDTRYDSDRKELLQPFSYGPRNCIGQNLALLEMQCVLTRIIWSFDLELSEECRNWTQKQKVFFFWEKPSLNVYMKPRTGK